jgi:hypothetical protein
VIAPIITSSNPVRVLAKILFDSQARISPNIQLNKNAAKTMIKAMDKPVSSAGIGTVPHFH